MVLSSIVLLMLAAVGVMVLGGLVLSVVLILSERTRVAGIVLLVLLLLEYRLSVSAWRRASGSETRASYSPSRSRKPR